MQNFPLAGAVIFARDLPKVAKFYEQIAALQIVHQADDHIVLEAPHLQLVIHKMRGRTNAKNAAEKPATPKRRTAAAIKLFLPVAQLADARKQAQALGGALQGPENEWEARGFRACDGHDPEGNIVQFRQTA